MADETDWTAVIEEIDGLQATVREAQKALAPLARRFSDALYDYADAVLRHRLSVDIPCGVVDLHTHGMAGAPETFWEFVSFHEDQVFFSHDCSIHGDGRHGCEDLLVPLMFFTHRAEWLTLAALAGEAPR